MDFTQANLYTLCAILLFAIGLLGFLLNTDFIKKIIGLNIIGIAIFMLLLATAIMHPNAVDPIPHAMVLTGIIVAAAGTALGLNLASKIAKFARLVQKEEAVEPESILSNTSNDTQGRG